MKNINGKFWRNSASLIVLNKRIAGALSCRNGVNFDVLLQTRTGSGSFPNSVVFPGGVAEPADESAHWLNLLQTFGYTQSDFEALHRPNTVITQIFQPDPVKRHVSLRITAIRETFEELGILLCSRSHKNKRHSVGADIIADIDLKHWQKEVSKNPEALLSLCEEYKCYPDIWSLYYWSNWLSPILLPKRFDTAFFLTVIKSNLSYLANYSEVTDVQWADPKQVLQKNLEKKLVLHPPQVYELNRLIEFDDIEKLIDYAKKRSSDGCELIFPTLIRAKDGSLHVLTGDDLWSSEVDLYKSEEIKVYSDKTVLQLREESEKVHRLEVLPSGTSFVFRNYYPVNHLDMGDRVWPCKPTLHKDVQ